MKWALYQRLCTHSQWNQHYPCNNTLGILSDLSWLLALCGFRDGLRLVLGIAILTPEIGHGTFGGRCRCCKTSGRRSLWASRWNLFYFDLRLTRRPLFWFRSSLFFCSERFWWCCSRYQERHSRTSQARLVPTFGWRPRVHLADSSGALRSSRSALRHSMCSWAAQQAARLAKVASSL